MTGKKRKTRKVSDAYKTFFEAMKTGSIANLCYSAYKFFDHPVLITDENYKLLCQYPRKPIGVDIWDTLLEKSVLADEVVKNYQQVYLSEQKKHYKPFYADNGLVENCPRIFGEIYTDERIVGHVAVFMFNDCLREDDLNCVQIFIDALNMLMEKKYSMKRTNTLENYFLDLLKPKTSKELKFLARTYLENHVKGNYGIMVTPVGITASDRARSTMMTNYISAGFRFVVSVIFEENVVTLFGLIRGIEYTESEKNFFGSVVEIFGDSQMYSGMSEPFSSLDEVYDRYKQAQLTSSIAERPISYFREAYPKQLFEIVRSHVNPYYFIMPELIQVHEYDLKNGTVYGKTLKSYITSFKDKYKTAEELCIHRNTLHYRLGRIKELFGIDVEDNDRALELMNCFQLLEVCENKAKE